MLLEQTLINIHTPDFSHHTSVSNQHPTSTESHCNTERARTEKSHVDCSLNQRNVRLLLRSDVPATLLIS